MTDFLCRLLTKKGENTSDSAVRGRLGILCSIVGVAVNFLLALAKILVGFFSGSVAIMADGLNNLSDAGSSGITFISFRIASKPADRDHPFGHARIEYVASLVVSFLIMYVGFDLFIDSGSKILGLSEQAEVTVELLSFIVPAASIVVKLLLGLFDLSIAKRIDSSVVKAAATDSFTDCISTAAVLASTVIVKLTGWTVVDSAVGLGVAVVIFIAGLKIMLETNNSILGEAPVADTVHAIENIVAEYPEIIGIHDMMVHDYGPGRSIASFHAEVNGDGNIYELHDTVDNVERRISAELGIICTVHLDPIAVNDEEVNRLRSIASECAKQVDPAISIHDFRTVIGTTHTNLIFDVVLPFESKLSEAEVTELISANVKAIDKSYFCVITVDRG